MGKPASGKRPASRKVASTTPVVKAIAVRLDRETWLDFKSAAARDGRSMQQVMADLLAEWLASRPKK